MKFKHLYISLTVTIAFTLVLSLFIIPQKNVSAQATKPFLKLPFDEKEGVWVGWIFDEQKNDEYGPHYGIDFQIGPDDKPNNWRSFNIYAAAPGYAYRDGIHGNRITIKHNIKDVNGNYYYTRYIHLDPETIISEIPDKADVDAKEVDPYHIKGYNYKIGKAGDVGSPGRIHLHFEVLSVPEGQNVTQAYAVDPYDLYRRRDNPRELPFYWMSKWDTLAIEMKGGPNSLWITIPGKPILVAPVNESVISDSSIQFQWQPVAGATEYLLCIRRWYNIKPIFLRPVGSETTYLYDNLPSDNVVYYWWVLAGNVTGWGQPSDEHSFVNGTLPPPQQLAPTDPRSPTRPSDLTLLSPANNSVIPGKEVTFEWSKTSGATSYYLYLQKIGEQHIIRKQIRNSTNYYHDQLDADGSTYKWKVEAKIWWLFSRTSTTWEFINKDDDTERRDKELNICEEWSAANSGGYGTTVDQWDISELPAGASFDIKFDTYQVPDKIVIQYQGVTVYDSGWRGQQRYIDNNPHLYPGGLAGPGQEELEGFFRKGSDDHFILTVFGPESSTEWRYYMRARCQD